TGAGGTRWTIATTIRYDRTRPVVVLDPIVELGADSNPVSLEYTVADPREPLRILGQLTRGRFVVRLLGRRTERAREFPAPPPDGSSPSGRLHPEVRFVASRNLPRARRV